MRLAHRLPVWLASNPLDMRAGADTALARVVQVFGAAQAHHSYLFAKARGTRMKLRVHDGFGIWCAARCLNLGRFQWPIDGSSTSLVRKCPAIPSRFPIDLLA